MTNRSNIIQFPSPSIANLKLDTLPIPHSVVPIVTLTSTHAIVSAVTARKRALTPEEQVDYRASLVRLSIVFALKKGISMASLPPQLRAWVQKLVDESDPTFVVLHEWLSGNRKYLSGVQDDTPANGTGHQRGGL
jgi:hypothetical protein